VKLQLHSRMLFAWAIRESARLYRVFINIGYHDCD